MPPIASLRTRIPAALLAGFEEERSTPMPTEGMRGITAICEQAGTVFGALARAAVSGGLGAVVAGNNASVPPPSQRISDMNNSGLASLGTLGALASSASGTRGTAGAAEETEHPAEAPGEGEPEASDVEAASDETSTEDAPEAAEEVESSAEAAPVETESEGASEVEEAPRRRHRARREDAPRSEPAVVEAVEPEVAPEPVEEPSLAEAHLPPPERDPFA